MRRLWWISTPLVLAAGCSGDGGGDPDGSVADASPTADSAPDADPGPRRPYRLASTGAQLSPVTGLTLGAADLATDVDVIAIHQDFYGMPWDAFRDQVEPPAAWVADIDAIAEQALATGKPIFLSLSPTDGGNRRRLAPRVVVNASGYSTDSSWKPECYDLGTAPDGDDLQDAFARYTTWMVERFAPRWVNVGVELNLFMPCGAAWEGMVDLEREAYLAAKAAAPGALVFPSIQIDHLYGRSGGSCEPPMTPDQCYAANYPRLQRLQRDRFAISTYPYLQDGITSPSTIPGNWFTRAADEGGEQLIIAETGWLATSAAGTLDGTCITQTLFFLPRWSALVRAVPMMIATTWADRRVLNGLKFRPGFVASDGVFAQYARMVEEIPEW